MINQLSEVVTNSPVNNLKKGIAKVQAGAYDEAATRAKVDAYLQDNAVSLPHSRYRPCLCARTCYADLRTWHLKHAIKFVCLCECAMMCMCRLLCSAGPDVHFA